MKNVKQQQQQQQQQRASHKDRQSNLQKSKSSKTLNKVNVNTEEATDKEDKRAQLKACSCIYF
jgi:hypothetical protein